MLITSHEISALVEFSFEIPWSVLLAVCLFPLTCLAVWLRYRVRELRIQRRYREPLMIGRISRLGPR